MTRDEYITLLLLLAFIAVAGVVWHVEQRKQARWSAVTEVRR